MSVGRRRVVNESPRPCIAALIHGHVSGTAGLALVLIFFFFHASRLIFRHEANFNQPQSPHFSAAHDFFLCIDGFLFLIHNLFQILFLHAFLIGTSLFFNVP